MITRSIYSLLHWHNLSQRYTRVRSTMTESQPMKSSKKTAATALPSVDEVVNMPLQEAMDWLSKLKVNCEVEDIETVLQCRERLLHILKENGVRGESQPVR